MGAMDRAKEMFEDAKEKVEEYKDRAGGTDESRAPGTEDTDQSWQKQGTEQTYPEGERTPGWSQGADETSPQSEDAGMGYPGTQGGTDFGQDASTGAETGFGRTGDEGSTGGMNYEQDAERMTGDEQTALDEQSAREEQSALDEQDTERRDTGF